MFDPLLHGVPLDPDVSTVLQGVPQNPPPVAPRGSHRQGGREPSLEGEVLPGLRRVDQLVPLSLALAIFGRCALWCVRLGKGHNDCHPLVAQVRAEASLSTAAGTPCAAACVVARSHQQRGHPLGPTRKLWSPRHEPGNLGQDGAWWWWCVCGCCVGWGVCVCVGRGVGVGGWEGWGGAGWVVQMIKKHAASVQGRAYVHLIGWQNKWEQAPGVPATPSPP